MLTAGTPLLTVRRAQRRRADDLVRRERIKVISHLFQLGIPLALILSSLSATISQPQEITFESLGPVFRHNGPIPEGTLMADTSTGMPDLLNTLSQVWAMLQIPRLTLRGGQLLQDNQSKPGLLLKLLFGGCIGAGTGLLVNMVGPEITNLPYATAAVGFATMLIQATWYLPYLKNYLTYEHSQWLSPLINLAIPLYFLWTIQQAANNYSTATEADLSMDGFVIHEQRMLSALGVSPTILPWVMSAIASAVLGLINPVTAFFQHPAFTLTRECVSIGATTSIMTFSANLNTNPLINCTIPSFYQNGTSMLFDIDCPPNHQDNAFLMGFLKSVLGLGSVYLAYRMWLFDSPESTYQHLFPAILNFFAVISLPLVASLVDLCANKSIVVMAGISTALTVLMLARYLPPLNKRYSSLMKGVWLKPLIAGFSGGMFGAYFGAAMPINCHEIVSFALFFSILSTGLSTLLNALNKPWIDKYINHTFFLTSMLHISDALTDQVLNRVHLTGLLSTYLLPFSPLIGAMMHYAQTRHTDIDLSFNTRDAHVVAAMATAALTALICHNRIDKHRIGEGVYQLDGKMRDHVSVILNAPNQFAREFTGNITLASFFYFTAVGLHRCIRMKLRSSIISSIHPYHSITPVLQQQGDPLVETKTDDRGPAVV